MSGVRREAGLTLIELVTALSVLALLAAVLTGVVRTGLFGGDRVERTAERLDDLRQVQRFLRQAIELARPLRWSIDNRSLAAFEGDELTLSFVATLPPWPGRGGNALVRLRLDGDRLVIDRRPTAGESAGFSFATTDERDVLLQGVAGVRFAYFGRDANAREGRWHRTWRDRHVLPDLVRLDIAYRDRAGPPWPSLVVRPQLDPAPR